MSDPRDKEAPRVSVDGMHKTAEILLRNYAGFIKHAPKMLRDSMMLAYQTGIEDMFKAMDKNRMVDRVLHEEKPPVILLDQNGFAAT